MKRVQSWTLVWRGIRSRLSGETQGRHEHRWYAASDLHWRVVSVLAAGVIGLTCLIEASPWGKAIEDRVARPAQFHFREWLQKAPRLDARIQIYSFDDASLAYLKADDIALAEWTSLLEAFRVYQPRAILLDMTFDTPRQPETAEAFVTKARSLPFPIIAGCSTFSRAIPERDSVPFGSPEYQLRRWADHPSHVPKWLREQTIYAYGPSAALLPAMRVGSISHGTDVAPLQALQDNRILASAPLLVAKDRRLLPSGLYLDGRKVSVAPNGLTLVNHPSRTELEARTTSVLSLITRVQAKQPLPVMPNDAHVVILPRTAPGTAEDAHKYAMVSVLNSVLTGKWLARAPFSAAQIAFLGLVGMLCGALLGGFWLTLAALGLTAAITLTGLFGFAWFGIEFPWFLGCVCFASTTLVVFVDRSAVSSTRALRLRASLHGVIPDATIETLIKRHKLLSFEPTGKTLTVMFIDVAGVSQAMERLAPAEGFRQLQLLNQTNAAIVHRHGGIVDRTLGDGMLCLFGHSFDTSVHEHDMPNAAKQALECAMEIQERCLERAIEAASKGAPVFPLRVGLNTDFVYFGDTGTGKKLEFAVIGDGVNTAKVLEAACESFRILLAASTLKALPPTVAARLNPDRRDIRLLNNDKLGEAYECNAYSFHPEMRSKAEAEYRRFAMLQRVYERWAVPNGMTIPVKCDHATGTLYNISENGFCVDFDRYLGIGVTLELVLDLPDNAATARLRKEGLLPVKTEVRWGTPVDGKSFRHGLVIRGLEADPKKALVAEIKKCLDGASVPEDRKAA